MDTLAAYYARRAAEYERVYAKPERQGDLGRLRDRIRNLLAGRRVLEIACGTGWWTEVIASEAAEVTALDLNDEMLAIARGKCYPEGRVTFVRGDCHALPQFGRRHDALLAAFWWSHVPLARLDAFLAGAEEGIAPGGLLVFVDNRYVEGSSTPVARRDAEGNTYQMRRLADGTEHEVLKNFPDAGELRARAGQHGTGVQIEQTDYYWLLCYRSRSATAGAAAL
ncbi:MAG: class I SAM-dependent methyltransferase [Betaproteobacteria bacterium]|nr:class I SAM-dependent methyltransferase [Betaproteobacteria bacterium]